jgi:hypothetical protein
LQNPYVASFSFIAGLPDDERDAVLARVRALAPDACRFTMRTERRWRRQL